MDTDFTVARGWPNWSVASETTTKSLFDAIHELALPPARAGKSAFTWNTRERPTACNEGDDAQRFLPHDEGQAGVREHADTKLAEAVRRRMHSLNRRCRGRRLGRG